VIILANPQLEGGYTRIANEILDELVKVTLNGTQWRIIAVVWRYTYGFSRKTHELSETFILKALDLNRSQLRQVKRELKSLIEYNILTVTREATFSSARLLAFQKDYEKWCSKRHQVTKKTPGGKKDTQPGDELDTRTGDYLVTQDKQKTNIKTNMAIDDFFESIWKLYPKKKGKGQISKKQKEKLFRIGSEELARAIGRYRDETQGKDQQYIMYGSTFFNGGYVDYLDENYQEPEPEFKDIVSGFKIDSS